MRLNQYIAQATGLSRRSADNAIAADRVVVNGQPGGVGQRVSRTDTVTLDGKVITPLVKTTVLLLNKPLGYVCSRNRQGNRTIYELLPKQYQSLKPVGRLDKDTSGLLLLTNDGKFAHELTHPSFQKSKIYEVELDRKLTQEDYKAISRAGVLLEDGPSKLALEPLDGPTTWRIIMTEGRNRQIRRTFIARGYQLKRLHRTQFGPYKLGSVTAGSFILID